MSSSETAWDIMSRLGEGENVSLRGATIEGHLDLTELHPQVSEGSSSEGLLQERVYVRGALSLVDCDLPDGLTAGLSLDTRRWRVTFERRLLLQGCRTGRLALSGVDAARGLCLRSSVVTGDLELSQARLADLDARDLRVTGETLLSAARVAGPADLRAATFEGDLVLNGTRFGEELLLAQASLKGIHALGLICGGALVLNEARFEGFIHMNEVVLLDSLDARSASFLEGGDWEGARFAEHASFEGAVFEGPAVFGRAAFEAGVSFVGARFESRLELDQATTRPPCELSEATILGAVDLFDARGFRAAGE